MEEKCPKCGSPLAPVTETLTGKKLQRCSTGSWDAQARKNVGCDYIKWLISEPETLDEKCPKCGSPVILVTTRFGKKMKKCSTNSWNKETREAEGCDFVQWIGGTSEELDEECPQCGKKLVLYTTAAGKKMKKCETSGWDREKKVATGCTYVQWLKAGEHEKGDESNGEEFLPPEPSPE